MMTRSGVARRIETARGLRKTYAGNWTDAFGAIDCRRKRT
jgi:hypothetical protein